jgi:hypothetical protein
MEKEENNKIINKNKICSLKGESRKSSGFSGAKDE